MNKKPFFLVLGRSGSGKSTIVSEICKITGMKQLQSYSTRKPRKDGETGHIFITRDDVANLGPLVAHTEFNGNFYGATSEQVENSDFYVIDKFGLDQFRKNYGGNKDVKIIYIVADAKKVVDNMIKRGDSYEHVMERMLHDASKFDGIEESADFVLNNVKSLDNAISSMLDYVLSQTKGRQKENKRKTK